MREITQGMLDRFHSRAAILGHFVDFDFGVPRRDRIKVLRRIMSSATMDDSRFRRKWDPVLKLRYRTNGVTGAREYFPRADNRSAVYYGRSWADVELSQRRAKRQEEAR